MKWQYEEVMCTRQCVAQGCRTLSRSPMAMQFLGCLLLLASASALNSRFMAPTPSQGRRTPAPKVRRARQPRHPHGAAERVREALGSHGVVPGDHGGIHLQAGLVMSLPHLLADRLACELARWRQDPSSRAASVNSIKTLLKGLMDSITSAQTSHLIA